MGVVGASLVLAAMGLFGVAGLRRLSRGRAGLGLDATEQIAFGAPLGFVLATLAVLPLAIAFGFGSGLAVVLAVACVVGSAVLLWPERWGRGGVPAFDPLRSIGLFPLAALVALGVVLAAFWLNAWDERADGIWTINGALWSDTTFHLADTTAFAFGDNFPPESTLLAGHAPGYHYLVDLSAAVLVQAGASPLHALALQGFVASVFLVLALFAFARRLTQDAAAAALSSLLWLFGGGVGWLATVREANRSHDLAGTLWDRPWNGAEQAEHNIRWLTPMLDFVAPQRSWLYGVPLFLLVLTLLLRGRERRRPGPFVAAGIVAATLPLAHLGALLALALVVPFLVIFAPWRPLGGPRARAGHPVPAAWASGVIAAAGWRPRSRPERIWLPSPVGGWMIFGLVWIVLGVPQILWLQGGEAGAAESIRWQIGWIAAPDAWWWFWAKNLGLFLPLLVLAAADRRFLAPGPRWVLWSCVAIFPIGNLAVFQPWDWDNTKIFLYWMLAVSVLVAASLTKAWRGAAGRPGMAVARGLVVVVAASLILSGVLETVNVLRGHERARLYAPEEVEIAREIRGSVPAGSLLAVGLQPNNAVLALGARPVLMSYPGWLWPRGFDAGSREADLRAIYRLDSGSPALIAMYGIDFVVVGPWERDTFDADAAAWRARYPVAIETATYVVLDVR